MMLLHCDCVAQASLVEVHGILILLAFLFFKKEVDVMSTTVSLRNHLPSLFSKPLSLLTKFQGLLETASTLQALDRSLPSDLAAEI